MSILRLILAFMGAFVANTNAFLIHQEMPKEVAMVTAGKVMDEPCNIAPNPGRIVIIAGGGHQRETIWEMSDQRSQVHA